MKIVAIDYSLNSPALAAWDPSTKSYTVVAFTHRKKYKPQFDVVADNGTIFNFYIHPYPEWFHQQERLHKVATALLWPVVEGDSVTFEGYALGMSASAGRIFDIAEGCQTVKSMLYRDHGIVPSEASPGQIKKFATGSGKASKVLMREAFIDRFGFDPASPLDNKPLSNPAEDIVDAVMIAEMIRWAK